MHASSLELMRTLRAHVPAGARVLDVGGANVNGSYRPLFADCRYTSLDFANADIVVSGYDWPIEDGAFDAVISGQMLEHDRFFWLTLKNIARVLAGGGIAIIIVPMTGGIHRHPVDCYRFMPDAARAFADWSGLTLLATERGAQSKWNDLGAVLEKPKDQGT